MKKLCVILAMVLSLLNLNIRSASGEYDSVRQRYSYTGDAAGEEYVDWERIAQFENAASNIGQYPAESLLGLEFGLWNGQVAVSAESDCVVYSTFDSTNLERYRACELYVGDKNGPNTICILQDSASGSILATLAISHKNVQILIYADGDTLEETIDTCYGCLDSVMEVANAFAGNADAFTPVGGAFAYESETLDQSLIAWNLVEQWAEMEHAMVYGAENVLLSVQAGWDSGGEVSIYRNDGFMNYTTSGTEGPFRIGLHLQRERSDGRKLEAYSQISSIDENIHITEYRIHTGNVQLTIQVKSESPDGNRQKISDCLNQMIHSISK